MFDLIPSPYQLAAKIIGILLLAALLFGVGAYTAHHIDSLKLQSVIDQNSRALADQKASAAATLAAANGKALQLQSQLADLTGQLNQEHEQNAQRINQIAADAARRVAAAGGLRIPADRAAGYCGANTGSAVAATADASRPATVKLPDGVTADLLALTKRADDLANDYATCYQYVGKVRAVVNAQQ